MSYQVFTPTLKGVSVCRNTETPFRVGVKIKKDFVFLKTSKFQILTGKFGIILPQAGR